MSESSEPPADSLKPEPPRVHGSHLVCAIRSDPDGTRFSTCPVCLSQSTLPSAGGWLNTKCPSCGCEFIASDGSPPPAPPLPPAPPPPIRKPEPAPSPPPPPRVVTEDIRLTDDGRPFVICPLCHRGKVDIPRVRVLRLPVECPTCDRDFIVKFPDTEEPRYPGAPPPAPAASPELPFWKAPIPCSVLFLLWLLFSLLRVLLTR